jgi:hypothetical protein
MKTHITHQLLSLFHGKCGEVEAFGVRILQNLRMAAVPQNCPLAKFAFAA